MSRARQMMLLAVGAILILAAIAAVILFNDPVEQTERTADDNSRDVRPSSDQRLSVVEEPKRMRSDLSISGSVTDDDGVPLAGASVCAFKRSSPTPFCGDSNSEGRYRIEQLSSDRYGMGASAKRHLADVREAWVDLTSGQSQSEIDFVLAKGAVAVTGRVVDRTGGPIAQAWVGLVRGLPVRSGADGAYELWVKAGPVAVSAEAEGYASSMESGTAPGQIDLRLMPESVLQGRVIDRKALHPVAGVVVQVYQFRTDSHEGVHEDTSAADGRFALRGLAAGQFEPRVASKGWFGRSSAPISLGVMETKEIEIEVERAFRVSGRVVTPNSKPCARRAVIAEGSIETESDPDADGNFVLDTVPPGETKLSAYCDEIWTEPLTIQVERDVDGVVLTVPDAARLQGIVVDSSGAPQKEIWVRAQNKDGSKSEESWTFSDGTFRMTIPWSG